MMKHLWIAFLLMQLAGCLSQQDKVKGYFRSITRHREPEYTAGAVVVMGLLASHGYDPLAGWFANARDLDLCAGLPRLSISVQRC
jgi:hypothetical protein